MDDTQANQATTADTAEITAMAQAKLANCVSLTDTAHREFEAMVTLRDETVEHYDSFIHHLEQLTMRLKKHVMEFVEGRQANEQQQNVNTNTSGDESIGSIDNPIPTISGETPGNKTLGDGDVSGRVSDAENSSAAGDITKDAANTSKSSGSGMKLNIAAPKPPAT